MDDKAYTCFYCHSILPYDVCISGTHFCLQTTNAIEFWGNVVKIASANSVEEQDQVDGEVGVIVPDNDFKQELNRQAEQHNNTQDVDEAEVFPDMETENVSPAPKVLSKVLDDSLLESHDGENDGVKAINWRLKMIALVKQRPPLYDKRLPLTERTFPIRAKLWKEVYDGLNGIVPIDLLPKRFKVLRDRYNKELKRRKLGHLPRKTWSLFKYLDFLSHAKKKICIRKMNLVNGESKLEDGSEKLSLEKLISSAGGEKVSMIDEESYKENVEIKRRFVELVGERPPLYDCRLPRSVRVAENKVKLWREVYDALDGAIPLVDLPRKFKSLRDRYMKEKKKVDSNEGPSTWPLMDYMTYLDDVAYIRSSQDSLINPSALSLNDVDMNHKHLVDEKKIVCEQDGIESLQGAVSSPLRNLSDHVNSPHGDSRRINIIVEEDLSDFKLVDGESESLLNSLNQKIKDSPIGILKNRFDSSLEVVKGGKASVELNKLKKLELLDTFDNWTEDDFFGAYLVKLIKKLPLEERLRLHSDIIAMITQSLKNHDISVK